MFKRGIDKKGWPNKSFKESDYAHPKASGVRNKIDYGTNKSQAINGT